MTKTSLRMLDTDQRDGYSRQLMQDISNTIQCEVIISTSSDFATCRLDGKQSTEILSTFNRLVIPTLNKYIETIMGSRPEYYNRSLILFETEVASNALIVRWAI